MSDVVVMLVKKIIEQPGFIDVRPNVCIGEAEVVTFRDPIMPIKNLMTKTGQNLPFTVAVCGTQTRMPRGFKSMLNQIHALSVPTDNMAGEVCNEPIIPDC